eukprot:gene3876-4837_t
MAAIYMLEGAVRKGGLDESGSLKSEMDNQFQSSFWGVNTADAYGRNIQRTMVTLQLDAQGGSNRLCRNAESGAFDFCNDTVCVATEAGTYTSTVGSLTSTDCPINRFAAEPASSACELCPPGSDTGNTTAAKECAPCANGHFQPLPGGECTQCPIGSFISNSSFPKDRCIECNELPGFYYQPNPGQSECMQCPGNTVKLGGSPGVRREECMCTKGFWRPDGLPGHACVLCPQGAICRGGLTQPVADDGMFAKTEVIEEHKLLVGYPFLSARVGYPEEEADPDTAEFDLPEIFFSCRLDWLCKSNFTCSKDRKGTLCDSCADGYFEVGDFCVECQGRVVDSVLTVFAWMGIVGLWVVINTISASEYDSLDIFLQYLQYVAITQGFSVPWPKDLRFITQLFSIANFNVDFYSPSCVIDWSSSASVMLTYCLPLIWASTLALKYGLLHLLHHNMTGEGFSGRHKYRSWTAMRFLSSAGLVPLVQDEEGLHDVKVAYIQSSLSMLNIIYNAICALSFSAFKCTKFPDGSEFLDNIPDIECGSDTHKWIMGTSALAIIVYVIGTPVFFFYNLYTMRQTDTLRHKHNVALWGWAFTRYEPGFWYWELVIMSRRLVLCLILVCISDFPHLQVFLAALFLVGFICLHFFNRPFIDSEVDILDAASLVSVLFYVLAGTVFVAEDVTYSQELVLTILLLLVTSATLVVACILFARQAANIEGTRLAKNSFNEYSAAMWCASCYQISAAFNGNLENLRNAMNAKAENGCITFQNFMEVMQIPGTSLGDTETAVSVDADLVNRLLYRTMDVRRDETLQVDELMETFDLHPDNVADVKEFEEFIASKTNMNFVLKRQSLSPQRGLMSSGAADVLGAAPRSPPKKKKLSQAAQLISLANSLAGIVRTNSVEDAYLEVTSRLVRNGGQMNKLFASGTALKKWVQTKKGELKGNQLLTAAIFDQLITPHISDTSELSPFSYCAEANFYRALTSECPLILEFMLQCSDEEADTFKTCMKKLYKMFERVGSNGELSRHILPSKWAPLLSWLVNANTQQRNNCKEILNDVVLGAEVESREGSKQIGKSADDEVTHQAEVTPQAAGTRSQNQVLPFRQGSDDLPAVHSLPTDDGTPVFSIPMVAR